MNDFFQLIKTRINTRVPAIKTVRMFNDQMNKRDTDRTEKPFPHPACFVEFIVIDIDNRALGIKDYIMTVRFRFSRVSEKFERPETFDFLDSFDQAIQLMAPTLATAYTFTTFQELLVDYDENHNNVENPVKDYRTRLRWLSGYQGGVTINGANLTLVQIIGAGIDFSQPYNSGYAGAISNF